MMNSGTRKRIILTAARDAASLHLELDINQTERIPVFEIIERMGIWLMFQPLKRLYGAYLRGGREPGILINSQHPLFLQRFTAAHEVGHHVGGHAQSVDIDAANTDFAKLDEWELYAQAFAGFLLMPLALLNRRLQTFSSAGPSTVDASSLYRISLDLGVSYEALVTQLAVTDKISWRTKAALLSSPLVDIKKRLANGMTLDNYRGNVWRLEDPPDAECVAPAVGDHIIILLPETPSTGFRWALAGCESDHDEETLSRQDDVFLVPPGNRQVVGAEGTHLFAFRVAGRQPADIGLELVRPWEVNKSPVGQKRVRVNPESQPTGEEGRGLAVTQWERLAARMRSR